MQESIQRSTKSWDVAGMDKRVAQSKEIRAQHLTNRRTQNAREAEEKNKATEE